MERTNFFKYVAVMGIFSAVFILLLAADAKAFTGYKGYSTLPEPLPTSSGELIYQEMGCVMCHGIQGDGNGFLAGGLDPKPRDFTDYKVMDRVPDQSIDDAVKNGIPGTAMPSFDLSPNQIEDLTAYLRSFAADTHLTVNACLLDTQMVDTNLETTKYRIEVEDPDLILVKKEGVFITINPRPVRVATRMASRKVSRTTIRLIQEDDKGERNLSLITVRIHKCLR